MRYNIHMKHEMGLQSKYFDYIRNGTKRIELRLFDEKEAEGQNSGDIIEFTNPDGEKLEVKVVGLLRYGSFEDLFADFDISILADASMTKRELLDVLNGFYSLEKQKELGVVMIDVKFDFTSDSPGYWDKFWENNDGLGGGGSDPDSVSVVLQRYNQGLWSKELPNGEKMELALGENGSLSWNGFRFGSDSIITSFRYKRQRALLERVAESMDDYRGFVEDFLHKTYTIGGEIIFPKHTRSINQTRGVNPLICDRFDLTLECIRRYYAG